MKKSFILLLLIVFSTYLSACSSAFWAADTLPWVRDEVVLFRDDFSHPTGGWTTHQDVLSATHYEQGGLRLWSDVPDYQFWSVPGLNFQDARIFVRARKLQGPDNNLMGVLCRYQDAENFYALVMGSDGYFGIYKRVDGVQSLIAQDHLDFSEAIQRGNSVNALQAVCQGEQLALFVNDARLLQVQDESLKSGDVGLMIGNFSDGGTDVIFDDFIVVKP